MQPYKLDVKYIFIYIIFILMLYYPTSISLYKLWVLDDWDVNRYSHGPLLLGVAIFLFYQRWSYLLKKGELNFRISLTGVLLVALSSFTWFYINSTLARQILLVMLLCSSLFMVLGYRSARKLMLPIILLVTAMPVWELVNSGLLQNIATVAVTKLLNVTGITAYQENFWIYIPAGSFFVSEYCSGIRQLMVAVPIALIYTHINWFKLPAIIIYLFVVVLMSIVANIVRIYIVVVAGQLTNMQHYLVQDEHVTLGWMIFGVFMFLFFYASNKIIRCQKKTIEHESLKKESNNENHEILLNKHGTLALILAIVSILIGPILNYIF